MDTASPEARLRSAYARIMPINPTPREAGPKIERIGGCSVVALIASVRSTSNRHHTRRLVRRHEFLENPSNLLLHRAFGMEFTGTIGKANTSVPRGPGVILHLSW